LIGGKGGVGKTTCAASKAMALSAAGARTLVVSTDPAPSLGDALQLRLGNDPRQVPGARGRLQAAEIDAQLAMRRWLRRRRTTLEAIAIRGTWLDERDVASLLSLSLPGIDELAALLEILRLGRSGSYDEIVIDTAPTGHTLRMLGMPETLAGVARVFDHMQEKHRAMVHALRGSWHPDDADVLIAELQDDARELRELLRDARRTEVSWVTTAEGMAVEETSDALRWLAHAGISVRNIIVNRVTPEPPKPCAWCSAKRTQEALAISDLESRLPRRAGRGRPAVSITKVLARDSEPVGRIALRAIGQELEREAPAQPQRPGRTAPISARLPRQRMHGTCQPFDAVSARLVMFGGKGGVGKTTCAAAMALSVAARHRNRRVLLLSTDPAHSLADVLDGPVSDAPRLLPGGPGNLRVRQLDSARAFESVRRRYSAAIDALFDKVAGGSAFDAAHDRRVMHGLLDLAPPGIDEVAAVVEVTGLLDGTSGGGRYDVIVMDTAPTGHAVRLLEMPALVQGWVKALMSIVLKYQPVAGVGDLGVPLLQMSRGISRLRALIADPVKTSFVVVTRAGAMPLAETTRLLRTLRRLRVGVPSVIVNAAGAGECSRCRRALAREARGLGAIRAAARAAGVDCVILAPAKLPAPVGRRELSEWRTQWVTSGHPDSSFPRPAISSTS
jgi:arsenite-transporting ATPase